MRGFVVPVLVILAMMAGCFAVYLGASLVAPVKSAGTVGRQCLKCRGIQMIDDNQVIWSCLRCGKWHAFDDGHLEPQPVP